MNKLDIEYFKNAKADFLSHLHRRNFKTWGTFNDELSLYCACFGLPVFVAIVFVEAEFPQFKEQLEVKKEIVRRFYAYVD